MAKIVLGMAASHGPLLATPPEQWDQRVEADKRNTALVYREGTFKFAELARLRADENLEDQIRRDFDVAVSARLPQSVDSNISGQCEPPPLAALA